MPCPLSANLEAIVKRILGLSVILGAMLWLSVMPTATQAQNPISTASHAIPQTDPFADVPLGTWPYTAMTTIQKAGVQFGYPDTSTYTGKRTLTPYEFALFITRLLPQLFPAAKTDAADTLSRDLQVKLERNPPALNALSALVEEFAPVLKRLRQNVPAVRGHLRMLQYQAQQQFPSGTLRLTPEQTRSPFADVPLDHWAYQGLDAVHGVKIVSDIYSPHPSRPVMTRLQIASDIVHFLSEPVSSTALSDTGGGLRDIGLPQQVRDLVLHQDVEKRFRHDDQAVWALLALIKEFTPELTTLQVNSAPVQSRLQVMGAILEAQQSQRPKFVGSPGGISRSNGHH